MIDSANFSAEGDSGSLIVDANTAEPVALLFAGDAASTVANPVADDLGALVDSNNVQPTFVGGAEHVVAACSLPPASATTPVSYTHLDVYKRQAPVGRGVGSLVEIRAADADVVGRRRFSTYSQTIIGGLRCGGRGISTIATG